MLEELLKKIDLTSKEIGLAVLETRDSPKTLLFIYKNCRAEVGFGEYRKTKWATVYWVETDEKHRDNGQASFLLANIKQAFENEGFDFGISFANNSIMAHIAWKLKLKEKENKLKVAE